MTEVRVKRSKQIPVPADIFAFKEKIKGKYVYLEFKKVNGEMRLLKGTTNLDWIPEDKHPKGTGNVTESVGEDTTVRIFDLEKQEWRSFKYENLTKIFYIKDDYKVEA